MKHLTEYNLFVRKHMPAAYDRAAARLGPGQAATSAAMKAVGMMWHGSHGSAMVGGRHRRVKRLTTKRHRRGGYSMAGLRQKASEVRGRIANAYRHLRYNVF